MLRSNEQRKGGDLLLACYVHIIYFFRVFKQIFTVKNALTVSNRRNCRERKLETRSYFELRNK